VDRAGVDRALHQAVTAAELEQQIKATQAAQAAIILLVEAGAAVQVQ
jgi:hypothetical protein